MRAVGVVIAIALALALQTTLARFVIGGTTALDLVLVVVTYVALTSGPVTGMLAGSVAARMRVRRLAVGEPIARAFGDWLGVTHCASEADDVRALWEQLLAREASSDGMLRHSRSSSASWRLRARLASASAAPRTASLSAQCS